MLAPSSLELSGLLWVFQSEPAGSLDLLLQNEKFKHALLGTKEGFERVASQIGGERRHSRGVLDLKDLVLAVFERRLEAILTVHTLALKHCDVLEATLSDLL